MDEYFLEVLPASVYVPPERAKREENQPVSCSSPKFDSHDFPSKNMFGQSDATVSPQDHCFTENTLEETGPSLSQDTMKEPIKENTLEMQYSKKYVPLMLNELHSPAAQPEPEISMAIYDMTSEDFEDIAGSNPYDPMSANEIVAGQYDELFPHLVGTDQQSSLANSQRMRTMVRVDTDIPDSMETSFPPRDEALQALIPEGLKWSVKTGHEFRPHLTIPRNLTRPISRVASVYEVKSPLSVTARVIKTPDQSPNQSPQRSPTRSPARSLTTIEEDSGTESTLVLKRRLTSHGGRARKKLFGDNGWLDDHRPTQTPRRRPSVMRQLGKKLKELKMDSPKSTSPTSGPSSPASSPNSSAPVSLTSAQQSKLYAELEVMICTTANDFIMNQYYDGRVSQQSIEKVHGFWASKNRPHVTEFRFDQATQRDLIMSNRRSLKFTGESSTNPIMLETNLSNWRIIAQEMNVRTFCLPDSVIRKHLHDTRNLLDMLDASLATLQNFRNVNVQAQDEMMDGYIRQYPRTASRASLLG